MTIQTRHSLGAFPVPAKQLFYAESASLVFYLVNRATPSRRDAVIAYLRAWYSSGLEKGSWSKLGFERVEDLESGYLAFLREAGH